MKLSQVVIGCLVAGMIALLTVALWPSGSTEPPDGGPPPPHNAHALQLPPKFNEPAKIEIPPAFPTTPETTSATDHEQKIATKCQEMMDLAMMDDQASLKKIWVELSNPEKEIRIGAVDAIVQFGDRSKVKALREVAEKADDPDEKKHILDAADFLTLPPMDMRPGATQVDTPLPPQTPAP